MKQQDIEIDARVIEITPTRGNGNKIELRMKKNSEGKSLWLYNGETHHIWDTTSESDFLRLPDATVSTSSRRVKTSELGLTVINIYQIPQQILSWDELRKNPQALTQNSEIEKKMDTGKSSELLREAFHQTMQQIAAGKTVFRPAPVYRPESSPRVFAKSGEKIAGCG